LRKKLFFVYVLVPEVSNKFMGERTVHHRTALVSFLFFIFLTSSISFLSREKKTIYDRSDEG
jgi:dolichol kinase